MVVRDGDHSDAPLEVLMVRRNLRSDFVGGAYVFPGGAVDPADGGRVAEVLCPTRSDAHASGTLGVGSGGLAYWVAAIRECFEEAGLLLAREGSGGPMVSFADPTRAERFAALRREINSRRCSFADVCQAERITLAVDCLHYFAHWITPEGSPRRYDTRFFVAPAPLGQTPAHDAAETICDVWIRPGDALAQHRAGVKELILPTIRSLQAISRFPTSGQLIQAAATIERVPAVVPRMVADETGARLLLPGDPGYDDATAEDRLAGGEVDFDALARAASRAANAGPAGPTAPQREQR
jgi:8-oxo-dGTP pyrophosphatase MutT (NUDIX family)